MAADTMAAAGTTITLALARWSSSGLLQESCTGCGKNRGDTIFATTGGIITAIIGGIAMAIIIGGTITAAIVVGMTVSTMVLRTVW